MNMAREVRGGTQCDWKTVLTGTLHKAGFSSIATSHRRLFKKKKKKKKKTSNFLSHLKEHHTLTFGELRSCSVTSWEFLLPRIQLSLLNVPHKRNVR
jgi:hypothetical protein